MDRVDEVAMRLTGDIGEPSADAEGDTTEAIKTTTKRAIEAAKPMPRWLMPMIAVEFLLVGVLGASAYTVTNKLNEITAASQGNSREVASWSDKTAALRTQTEGLKSEIVNLRQFIASSSSEDVIFLKATILKPDIDPEMARTIARNVHHYAELYGRDPNLVLAIIAVESRFDPKAVSPVGATGLMQVMPQWKKVLGITGDLADPELSIKYGLQILGFYDEMYKNLEMALTAYNRGPGPVDTALRHGKDPTNNYAPRVLQTYDRLKKLTVSASPT
jgi:soluble lytic murein transglycosylase-like protein